MQMTVNERRSPARPCSNKLFPGQPATDPEDVGWLHGRVELDVISVAAPEVTHVRQEVVNLVNIRIGGTEIVHRNVDVGTLEAGRIEIYDDDNDVVARFGHLAVAEDGVVIGMVETEIVVELKGPVFLADLIDANDPVLDV